MIQQEGYLTLIRRNSGKLTDADFARAKKEGCLKELIESCDLDHIHGPQHNLINHLFSVCMFTRLFSGGAGPETWNNNGADGWAFLTLMYLATTDSEPAVTDVYQDGYYTEYAYLPDICSTTSWKRFEEDQAEIDEIKSSPLGREDIYYRERWLFAPSISVSSNIRSVTFLGSESATNSSGYGVYHGRAGRIRLKDANGLPVIYSKTANQILLAEYKFILASV